MPRVTHRGLLLMGVFAAGMLFTVRAQPVYYICDCQAGAEPGCVPGSNTNDGTSPSVPFQTIDALNVNSAPAGTQVLFAQGGSWTDVSVFLDNRNATADSPVVFDSYAPSWGGTARPLLRNAGGVVINFGQYEDPSNDGGYTIRNLKLDGDGTGQQGLWLHDNLRNVTVENLEITGFQIGVHCQTGTPHGVTFFTIRNSSIHHNAGMGMLCNALDMVIEDNVIAGNNFSGSGFSHGIYLGGHGERGVVRRNLFSHNSTVSGVCTGGNLTVHGQWDGLLVENNTILQDSSAGGCYGISIKPDYSSAEWFRGLVVRGNTIVNVGYIAIGVASAPGVIIENNVVINARATNQSAVQIPANEPGAGDAADSGATIRNNSVYFGRAANGSTGINTRMDAGEGIRVVSNLVCFGAGSTPSHYCFGHGDRSRYSAFDNNLCYDESGSGRWSSSYGTLAAAQAAGFDNAGLSGAPQLTAIPASVNNYSMALDAGSPAIDAGHPALSALTDITGRARTGVADIGAWEYGSTMSVRHVSNNAGPSPSLSRAGRRVVTVTGMPSAASIRVHDMLGRELAGRAHAAGEGFVDITALANGIYLLRVQTAKRTAVWKLPVQRR